MLRLLLLALLAAPASAQIYVDQSATGAGTGTSWANAYTGLQPALARAQAGAEVWVAQGRYTPAATDRRISFKVRGGVAVYGGFPAGGGPFTARDPDLYPTVLSGDLAGNDGPGPTGIGENTHTVVEMSPAVTGTVTTPDTILHGLTITGGNTAGAPSSVRAGGGLRCASTFSEACEPTLRRVRFVANRGDNGGGAYFLGGTSRNDQPTLIDCVFEGNYAVDSFGNTDALGGGLYVVTARLRMVGGAFVGNRARLGGGAYTDGVFSRGPRRLSFETVRFKSNDAEEAGGGVYHDFGGGESALFVDGSTFTDNEARDGAAIALTTGDLGFGPVDVTVRRSTFVNNRTFAGGRGGAVFALGYRGAVRVTLAAVGFFGNAADQGSAIHVSATDGGTAALDVADGVFTGTRRGGVIHTREATGGEVTARVAHASFVGTSVGSGFPDGLFLASGVAGTGRQQLVNSAALGAGPVPVSNVVSLDHVVLDGGCPPGIACTAVVDADPGFLNPAGPDGVVGTPDDDLRLPAGAPGVDAGLTALVPPDAADLDDDGDTEERLPLDLRGALRDVGAAPDAGAYERGGVPVVVAEALLDRPAFGPAGGALPLRFTITNTTSDPVSLELWADRLAPDGTATPTLDPDPLGPLAPGASVVVERTVSVPPGLAVGAYAVRARIGTFPNAVVDEDLVAFTVTTVDQFTVDVTTTEDQYGGVFGTPDDGCGLREAIETVNRGEPFGQCTVEGGGSPALIRVPAGLYLLTRDTFGGADNRDRDLDILVPVRIVGGGMTSTFVSAAALTGDAIDRVIQIQGDGAMPVELSDLSVSGGRPYSGEGAGGGGIRAIGADLTLTRVDVNGNDGGDGGGLYHAGGTLTLVGTTVHDNEGANGGGVYHSGGDLIVQNTTVTDNTTRRGAPVFDDERAGDGGRGGGLYVTQAGTVTLEGAEVSGNTTGAGGFVGDDDGVAGRGGAGAGLFVRESGAVSLVETLVADNTTGAGGGANDGATGAGGAGGGLYLRDVPSLTLRESRVTANVTGAGGVAAKSDVDSAGGRSGQGGGLYLRDVNVVLVSDAEISGNATGPGGDGYDNTAGTADDGGGLYLSGGGVRIERTLIAGNRAGDGGALVTRNSSSQSSGGGGDGGGLYAVGLSALELTNVTVSGNEAGAPGATVAQAGAPGTAGGLHVASALQLRSVTLTDNAVPAGSTGGGLLLVGATGFRSVANSVLAGNRVGTDPAAPTADCVDSFLNDVGFNVVGAGTGCPATDPTTETVAPAEVFVRVLDAALAENGGPTRTHALVLDLANPALDIGGTCGPTDQRGVTAPAEGPDPDADADCDAGAFEASSMIVAAPGTAIPTTVALQTPYPNPTSGIATIRFSLPTPGPARLTAYDMLGREVARIADGPYETGWHTAVLDASRLPAGRYVVRLTTPSGPQTAPLTVVR